MTASCVIEGGESCWSRHQYRGASWRGLCRCSEWVWWPPEPISWRCREWELYLMTTHNTGHGRNDRKFGTVFGDIGSEGSVVVEASETRTIFIVVERDLESPIEQREAYLSDPSLGSSADERLLAEDTGITDDVSVEHEREKGLSHTLWGCCRSSRRWHRAWRRAQPRSWSRRSPWWLWRCRDDWFRQCVPSLRWPREWSGTGIDMPWTCVPERPSRCGPVVCGDCSRRQYHCRWRWYCLLDNRLVWDTCYRTRDNDKVIIRAIVWEKQELMLKTYQCRSQRGRGCTRIRVLRNQCTERMISGVSSMDKHEKWEMRSKCLSFNAYLFEFDLSRVSGL